jgi:hypothetical protein
MDNELDGLPFIEDDFDFDTFITEVKSALNWHKNKMIYKSVALLRFLFLHTISLNFYIVYA